MPTTPFIGVRISWLMFARNWDLSRALALASSIASRSACSVRLRSVISRTMPMAANTVCSMTMDSESSTGNSEPSLRRAAIPGPANRRAGAGLPELREPLGEASRKRSGTTSGWNLAPIASALV